MAGGDSRFGVLGPLVFERDGQAVPVPSGRQRSLLALLLLAAGAPQSRDRLIDELWGERAPASAVSALHVHLSKLRALLGEELLVLEPAGYALRPGLFELDAREFDRLVEQARGEPEQARALLERALSLFRGEPLGDVAAEGSLARWRRELEEKRLQATLARIDADLAAGRAGELVAELERLAGEHPYEERLWAQLMLGLYRAGRQAEALEAYQRARRLFASELGLAPGEPLARLQQQILDRDSALLQGVQPESELTPGHTRARRARSNLPRALTRLVGREAELRTLRALAADPDVRMVTLTGTGGVGKTRLLLELGRLLEDQYSDGVAFVRLERVTDPALVAAEIAATLAARDGTDVPSADSLTGYLADRELLLAVDNFEHLVPAAVLLADLLGLAPKLRVVATSRIPLRIRGEQVFAVEPLPLPTGEDENALGRSPAVQLFLQCALAANRALVIDDELTVAVAEICRAIDGLPLAIELAASRVQTLSVPEIAAGLAEPLRIGEHALRDLPERQQTLVATIRWSYDLLTDSGQEALRGCGAFLGGFTVPALEAVIGRPVHKDVEELLTASLIRRQAQDGRFELLELVRAFARDQLERGGETPRVRSRLREYLLHLVAAPSDAFDQGAAPGEVAAPMLADHANIRAALSDATDAGDQPAAVGLALGLRPVWLSGMLRQEAQELAERVLERFEPDPADEMRLLRAVAFVEGFGQQASSWTRRMAKRAAELGDQDAMVTATGNLFGRALNARDRDEMRRLRPTLIEMLTPETGDKALGWLHYFLSLEAYVNGRFEAASEHATLSVEKAEQTAHEYMLASATGARLLATSARDEMITQLDLAQALEIMRKPSIGPLAAFALWLVARYAVGVDREAAGRWLAHGERILAALDSVIWPESVLRDETIALLGIDDVSALLAQTPPLDHAAAMAEAAAWVAGRDPAERSPREGAREFLGTSLSPAPDPLDPAVA